MDLASGDALSADSNDEFPRSSPAPSPFPSLRARILQPLFYSTSYIPHTRLSIPLPHPVTTNMISVLAGIRYALFALYTICSGVLVTAASWHLGLANTIGASTQLDGFIIFLGAFGLLFVLAIAFIDTLRKYAVTSTVWFELAWVGLFWVFYLAAASAATAIGPSMFCGIPTANFLGWKDACVATKVIMTFTWIGTIFFLTHLFTLLALSLLHAPQSPGVWYSGVRDFPWLDFATRPSFRNSVSANAGVRMGSEPSSPTKYHYERRMAAQPGAAPVTVQPAVAAPIYTRMTNRAVYPSHEPQHYPTHPFAAVSISRPAPAHDLESLQPYQYKPERDLRAKTQSQTIVEQFRAGQALGSDGRRSNSGPGQLQSSIVRALPKLPPSTEVESPRPHRANPGLTEEQVMGTSSQLIRKLPEPQGSNTRSYQQSQPPSLYPLHVQSTMDQTQTPAISYSEEPQPLGDWPRRNPPADPRRERNPAPPPFRATEHVPTTISSAGPMTASGAQERVARRMDSTRSAGSGSGGSVDSDGIPRRKDGRPKHRPPPLDFSKLNAGRQ